jgi:hypothetical protein
MCQKFLQKMTILTDQQKQVLWYNYYEGLSLVPGWLAGFALQFVERPVGIGIAAFLAFLCMFFVCLGSFVFRNLLIRGTDVRWYGTLLHLWLSLGGLSYAVLLLLLCVPYLTSVSVPPRNSSLPFPLEEQLLTPDRPPLLLAFIAFIMFLLFVSTTLLAVYQTNSPSLDASSEKDVKDEL